MDVEPLGVELWRQRWRGDTEVVLFDATEHVADNVMFTMSVQGLESWSVRIVKDRFLVFDDGDDIHAVIVSENMDQDAWVSQGSRASA